MEVLRIKQMIVKYDIYYIPYSLKYIQSCNVIRVGLIKLVQLKNKQNGKNMIIIAKIVEYVLLFFYQEK